MTEAKEVRMPRAVEKNGSRTQSSQPGKANGARLPFAPLDKNSFIPMYFQIQSQLLNMIESGLLQNGDPLPSEEELTRVYGVSRMTARQALLSLKSQGLASRHKGRGTFVIRPVVNKDIAHLKGFTAEMETLGMKPSSKVLEKNSIPAPVDIAVTLQVEPGTLLFSMHRLRFADNEPIALETVWLTQSLFPGIENIDFSRESLYETLRERYSVRLRGADEILEARAASRREADLLDTAPRSCLLAISRTLWSLQGRPIEVGRSLYRGDRYRAVLRIPISETEG
jgi:GntR family transcriptional regulator